MHASINHPEPDVTVSLGRQPVFDARRQLWGYELFCVGGPETSISGFPKEENVAVSMASSAYLGLQQIIDRGKKIMVTFSEKNILDNLPYALPPILAAVIVEEDVYTRPLVPEMLSRLKSDGYLIAVARFSGDPAGTPLYSLADIICIDVAQKGKDRLYLLLEIARKHPAQLLAYQVEDHGRFNLCSEMGFSLFHGPFFKAPETITIRTLSSVQISRFNLLHLIEQDQPDFARLAGTIQADVTISFRLLSYLNSAAFGFSKKIQSIHQAITLLGWRKMKNWLRVVLLTDVSENKNAPELVLLSAQRGKFLELVARDHDFWGFDPDSMHLLGIFSLLDAMLGMPMAEIVAHLPLEHKLKAALCRERNNEYLPLLNLTQYLEEAHWEEAQKMIQQLNLNSAKVKAAFQASLNWADELAAMRSAQ